MTDDGRESWERAPFESAKAFHAFCHFRDAGAGRSIAKGWSSHRATCGVQTGTGRVPSRWKTWSSRWGWVERADAWDADVEKQKRSAFLATQVDAAARHARMAQAGLQVVAFPVRCLLDKMSSPAYLASLDGLSAVALLREARAGLSLVSDLIASERLSLGMTTGMVEVDDHRESRFANAVVANPAAVKHLIACLDEIAGTDDPAPEPAAIPSGEEEP
jgi:hypothetical protein